MNGCNQPDSAVREKMRISSKALVAQKAKNATLITKNLIENFTLTTRNTNPIQQRYMLTNGIRGKWDTAMIINCAICLCNTFTVC